MPGQTETRLPWGQDTITVKGGNSGVQALTVHFDGETLNIVDFLNHSLNAEYAARCEAVMSKYEPRLKTGSLFDHAFPETAFTPQKITPSRPEPAASTDDKTLIAALLKEYTACLDHLQAHFKEYEISVEQWSRGSLLEKM
jgi:hypothetical protein